MTEVERYLAKRAPLARKLDSIRSRGLYEHGEELRSRNSGRRLVDEVQAMRWALSPESTLLRDGSWYASSPYAGETYEFERTIEAQRASGRDEVLLERQRVKRS